MPDTDLTIPEACAILEPAMEPKQLRAIISALGWPSTGYRHNGRSGRPHPTYPWTRISALHAALLPFHADKQLLCACVAMPT